MSAMGKISNTNMSDYSMKHVVKLEPKQMTAECYLIQKKYSNFLRRHQTQKINFTWLVIGEISTVHTMQPYYLQYWLNI